ncbi:hypothetical protein [Flammeovirga kamogawensis]|uniref:T9SS type A sorting domain-containing protein n=1 Tax=Flammeovirga kamogawensis TaxID=373891 RepID=A0ABX8H279_9BACT|nr:hypothetical protein [Flammeovirga kamogawensis]MBB6462574.1 hypothetical protein [Flammeovirga kamogawensis]QWG09677.1 hypothetical protein KM029_24040 [Flammeovirga kamogawensis]TRX65190.1 hypothetical protein EO216_21940 [Flammeovirga kamogawensis]
MKSFIIILSTLLLFQMQFVFAQVVECDGYGFTDPDNPLDLDYSYSRELNIGTTTLVFYALKDGVAETNIGGNKYVTFYKCQSDENDCFDLGDYIGYNMIDNGDDSWSLTVGTELDNDSRFFFTYSVTNGVDHDNGAQTSAFDEGLVHNFTNCNITEPDDIELPVELISFTSKVENDLIILEWQTASEQNSSKFEIEVSTDMRHFSKIGEVKSAGNSAVLIDYQFIDSKIRHGKVYYRLKQVDLDGKYEFFGPLVYTTSTFDLQTIVKLKSNQLSTFIVDVNNNQNYGINVFSLQGELIYSRSKVQGEQEINLSQQNKFLILHFIQGREVKIIKIAGDY